MKGLRLGRIEAHDPFEQRYRLPRFAAIDGSEASSTECQSKVGVERERSIVLRGSPLVVLQEEGGRRGNEMRERIVVVLGDGLAREAIGLCERPGGIVAPPVLIIEDMAHREARKGRAIARIDF